MKNKIPEKYSDLILILKTRFDAFPNRHPNYTWLEVEQALAINFQVLESIYWMEESGGEPDVVELDEKNLVFCDCSAESPLGRRSLCYDREAMLSRKENAPANNAMGLAHEKGLTLLDELLYRKLQSFGKFDSKTSSWISTPAEIRLLGGALFADFRFGRTFVYHNTAQSYYGARGFRGYVTL
jgi:hypothetical protein